MKKILTLSILAASSLFSATPNVDAIERSITTPKIIDEKSSQNKNELVEIGGKSYAPVMVDDKSGKKIFIKDFIFEANDHIDSSVLNNLTSEFKNQELTFSELQNIASIITKEYRNQGYFVARAYLPKQNIEENKGVLKISVIEGKYGEFKLENNSRVKDFIAQSMLDDAKKRDNVVSTNTLERSMLIINDIPGSIVTQADVRPGKEVGTSNFLIKTEKTALFDGYLVGDNYGSTYTGKNRLMAGINLNSPLQIGDKLSVSGLITNGENIKNYRVGYDFPLMANGLRGQTSYSKTNYDLVNLGQNTPDDIYDGHNRTVELGITYPIIRSRVENLNFSTLYSNKELKDYYDSNISKDRDINSVKIGLDYTKTRTLFGYDSIFKAETFYTLGKLNINDEQSRQQDKDGVDTQGSYSKLNLNLGNELLFNPIYSLSTNLKSQYAFGNKNLDGSEDFTLGGSDGVKVFSDSEQNVENGLLLNIELFAKLPEISIYNHKVGLFYDLGTGNMSDSSKDDQFRKRTLQDLGLGYYSNYKNTFAKLQIARIIGGEDIETENVGNISKILFQAGFVF